MIAEATVVRSESTGRELVLESLIGEGGQGTVYRATTADGRRVAVKWYRPASATPAQRAALLALIERGRPNADFLWPEELVSGSAPGFGYVMPLRPDRFVGMADLLNGRVDVDLRVICTVAFGVANAFLMLHSEGLCYRDISLGNIFFDPATGAVLICDNDNVGIDGVSTSNVLGTRRFMAPEIVRRAARPGTTTDLHSVAVLIFYLLMLGHPLLGRRELEFGMWSQQAESELFGEHPVFVFDPLNEVNRPSEQHHGAVLSSWDVFPTSTQLLFVEAFTRGLREPETGRVREGVWRAEMVGIRDLLGPCPRCAKQNFFDGRPGRRCWSCGTALGTSLHLTRGQLSLHLSPGERLTSHHLLGNYDFDTVIGVVQAHPQSPTVLGLHNSSSAAWSIVADGRRDSVEPGRSVRLFDGLQLTVNGTRLTVREK